MTYETIKGTRESWVKVTDREQLSLEQQKLLDKVKSAMKKGTLDEEQTRKWNEMLGIKPDA